MKSDSTFKSNKRESNLKKINSGNWTIAEIAIHYKATALDQQQICSVEETYSLISKLWDHEKICNTGTIHGLFLQYK
jgi:hypothetical protein